MSESRTQFLATFLIVFGAACIALGSKYGWHDLVSFATAFGGGGVGILTGQRLTQQVVNQDNATPGASPEGK